MGASARSRERLLTLRIGLDAELNERARRVGVPATTIAREAIEEWVARQKRLADEIRSSADATAGTGVDLDEVFEAGWRELGREARHSSTSPASQLRMAPATSSACVTIT
jgi:predicted transcriptional regulator